MGCVRPMETTEHAPGVHGDMMLDKVGFCSYDVVDHLPDEDFHFRFQILLQKESFVEHPGTLLLSPVVTKVLQ